VLFGLAMTISSVRFLLLGWINEQYVAPKIHFPYYGLSWVQPLPEYGLYAVYGALLLSSLGVMVGAWYRISSVILFLAFTYIELLDKTYYLNHYYFVSIVAFLFCLVPANRAWSVDARMKPSIAVASVPRWTIAVFMIQISMVYVFAGIAKITPHWLLDAMPLRIWLPANDTLPVIGPIFSISWMPWVFSWAGMIYDCTVPFFLMWHRTRLIAYAAVIGFHVVTGMMFQIGVFPLVMILMTLVFFPAQYHEYALRRLTGMTLPESGSWNPTWGTPRLMVVALHLFLQVVLPFRFLLYPGDLYWTEQGYRFSWRVMLMEKAGYATFTVHDPESGRKGVVNNRDWLNAHQEKQMAFQPDMILQFAHVLRDAYSKPGYPPPKVTAEVWVTMNGERSRLLVDPNRDLGKETDGFHHFDWILPR
jgi:hypothetical protein